MSGQPAPLLFSSMRIGEKSSDSQAENRDRDDHEHEVVPEHGGEYPGESYLIDEQ